MCPHTTIYGVSYYYIGVLMLLNDSRSIVWHGFHVVAEDWITYPDDYIRHATASLTEHAFAYT